MTTSSPQPKPFLLRAWHVLVGEPPLDHRGRTVRIIAVFGEILPIWTRLSGLPPDVHKHVAFARRFAHQGRVSPPLKLEHLIAVPLFMLAAGLFFAAMFVLADTLQWAAGHLGLAMPDKPALFLLTVMFAGLIGSVVFRRHSAPTVIHECLLFHHCPSCAHTLDDLRAESDGCTVCVECGAAWRVPPHAYLRFRTKTYPTDSQAHPRPTSDRKPPLS